jgi:hypothetical protein
MNKNKEMFEGHNSSNSSTKLFRKRPESKNKKTHHHNKEKP